MEDIGANLPLGYTAASLGFPPVAETEMAPCAKNFTIENGATHARESVCNQS